MTGSGPPQPTPDVDMADVERVVRRDYPADLTETILREIAAVEVREMPRVILACLKIGGGDLKRLRGELANASGWWREILSEAEYPLATKRWGRMKRLSHEEQQAIYDKDWKQYSEWLHRK